MAASQSRKGPDWVDGRLTVSWKEALRAGSDIGWILDFQAMSSQHA
ncbi:hypothetical protein [Methylobacterium sp. WL9]|nr:hypothetical protein [Methylobacterium sp. WL9]